MFDKVYLIKSISAVTNYNSSSCFYWYYLLILSVDLSAHVAKDVYFLGQILHLNYFCFHQIPCLTIQLKHNHIKFTVLPQTKLKYILLMVLMMTTNRKPLGQSLNTLVARADWILLGNLIGNDNKSTIFI